MKISNICESQRKRPYNSKLFVYVWVNLYLKGPTHKNENVHKEEKQTLLKGREQTDRFSSISPSLKHRLLRLFPIKLQN